MLRPPLPLVTMIDLTVVLEAVVGTEVVWLVADEMAGVDVILDVEEDNEGVVEVVLTTGGEEEVVDVEAEGGPVVEEEEDEGKEEERESEEELVTGGDEDREVEAPTSRKKMSTLVA